MKNTVFKVGMLLIVCLLSFAALYSYSKNDETASISKFSKINKVYTGENFVKPSDKELKEKLSKMQYKVTQKDGTEPPFKNEYWDNKEPGIYVDVVSGEPLFASVHKYKSGTGWPSFFETIAKENIVSKVDKSLFRTRTEIRSKNADSHLGHVFEDGPADSTGLRYCMNSAALRFVPKDKMEEEGYAKYLTLFEENPKL